MDFQKMVDGIAAELKAVYNGELLADAETAERYGIEENEPIDMFAYLFDMDVYNTEYVVASDKETLLGVRLLVACGGPNIYINTWENSIDGYWWGSTAKAWIPSEVADAITEAYQMVWSC